MNLTDISPTIINSLKNKKILILGLGREGRSTYEFLRQILPDVQLTLADQNHLENLNTFWQTEIADNQLTKTQLGADYLQNLTNFDLIFKTPGIPLNIPELNSAEEYGVFFSSNLQLFLQILTAWQKQTQTSFKNTNLPLPLLIGVTGTKGKSTTSSLIAHVLQENNLPVTLVGNIGTPALSQLKQISANGIVVMEMSSHQLAQLSISPDIAVVQKITSEHLDYYQNQQKYIDAKKPITKYQKVDQYIIYNPSWIHTKEVAEQGLSQKIHYGNGTNNLNSDVQVYIKNNKLILKDSKTKISVINIENSPLLGQHNLFNIMPSIAVGTLLKIEPQNIAQAIQTFQPLPHRLEKVAEINGVTYVNDSLATMPDAAVSAIKAFPDKNIVLLAGGHERHQSFTELAQTILKAQIKGLILFPPTGKRLWEAVKKQAEKKQIPAPKHLFVENMKTAVKQAQELAQTGDLVLLSPAAASFGVFKNYQDRGEQFKQVALSI